MEITFNHHLGRSQASGPLLRKLVLYRGRQILWQHSQRDKYNPRTRKAVLPAYE